MASLPFRYYLIFCFSEVALARLHFLVTCRWGPSSPNYEPHTVLAEITVVLWQILQLLNMVKSSVDARCRNCVTAWQYHWHSFLGLVMVFMPPVIQWSLTQGLAEPPTAYVVFMALFRMALYHYTVIHIYDGVNSLGSYGALCMHWLPQRVVRIAQRPVDLIDAIERAQKPAAKEAAAAAEQRHASACLSTPAANGDDPYEASVDYLLPTCYRPGLVVHTV